MRKKREHVNVRIPTRLYEMVAKLKPLFDGEFSEALNHILKNYEFSADHKVMTEKLERMRFEVWFGEARLADLQKEMSKMEKLSKKEGNE